MPTATERLHPSNIDSPLTFSPKDPAVIIPAQPHPILFVVREARLNPTVKSGKVDINSPLVLGNYFSHTKPALSAQDVLGVFDSNHIALQGDNLNAAKALIDLLTQNKIVAYRWPYNLPAKTGGRKIYQPVGKYYPPQVPTLAELAEKTKNRPQPGDNAVLPTYKDEPLHSVTLNYTYPDGSGVVGKPFIVKVDGVVATEGKMNSDGSVTIDGLMPGKVEVIYEDDVSAEIKQTRAQLKKALDAILKQNREQKVQEDAVFNEQSLLGKTGNIAGNTLKGAAISVSDISTNNTMATYKIIGGLIFARARLNNAIYNTYKKVVDGVLPSEQFADTASKALDANNLNNEMLADELGAFDISNPVNHKRLAESYKMATFLVEDSETRSILMDFAQDYAATQSVSDWAYIGGGALVEMTYGLMAGKSTSAAALKDLSELLKKAKTNTQNSGATNTELVNNAEHPKAIPLTRNTRAQAGDASINEPGATKTGLATKDNKSTDTRSEPISMITGEELLELTDISLDGPIPLVWSRTYRSSNPDDIGLGHGWTHSLSDYLVIDGEQLYLHDHEGRIIPFLLPKLSQRSHNTAEGLSVLRTSQNDFLIAPYGQPTGIQRHFSALSIDHKDADRCVLSAIEDQFGNGYRLLYDKGLLTDIVGHHDDGLHLEYIGNHISSLKHYDNIGNEHNATSYTFNDQNDLITATDAQGFKEFYQYSNHIITQRRLKSGHRFYFEWDQLTPNARCLHQWGDPINGQATYDYRFTWDTPNHRVTVTDTRGGQETFQYNERAQLTYHCNAEGGETYYRFNEQQQLSDIIHPDASSESLSYNDKGQVTKRTDILGNTSQIQYDRDGLPVRLIDADGNHWVRRYNEQQQLTAVINPLGQTTRYGYNAMGLIGSVTDPSGHTTRYWYNPRGQLTRLIDAQGRATKYRYNSKHQLSEIGQGDNKASHYTYHQSGQVASVTTPDGQTSRYRYTALGLLESITDAAGRETRYNYDGLSQITQRINPDGSSLTYEYDGERNLTALINEKGERYQLAYDKNERLIQEIGFDGRTTDYRYNIKGHLTEQLERANCSDTLPQITQYKRDAAGQLIIKTTNDGQTLYDYNSAGQLLSANNPHRQLKWQYDPAGRLTQEWQDKQVIQHHYDERDKVGLRTRTILPNGQQLRFNYNASGQFTAMRWRKNSDSIDQFITHLHHNLSGQEIRREHGNGLSTLQAFDPQGRLQAKEIVKDTTQYGDSQQATNAFVNNILGNNHKHFRTIAHKAYRYDSAGRLSQIDDRYLGNTHYHYDPLDRLTQVEGPHPEHIIHDPANNILAIHNDKNTAKEQAQSAQVKNNRLQFQGDTHYQYDTFGNRIKKRRGKNGKNGKITTAYRYNAQHQLSGIANSQGKTSFKYDALGRRTCKTHKDKNGHITYTEYLWQGDQLLEERTTENKKTTNQQTYLFKPNSFEALALIKDEKVYSYHLDHLGTPEALSDENGEVVWYVGYSSYGKIAVNHGDNVLKVYQRDKGDSNVTLPEIHQPLRFQGQYFDEETHLHYNRYRYYDPNTGSFLTQDPIKLLGGINNYLYTPNPISWIDPLGLACKEDINDPAKMLPAPRDSNPWMPNTSIESDVVGKNGMTVYRAHGEGRATGGWVTAEAPPNQSYVRKELAVAPEWNDATHYSEIKLAPGTRYQSGIAGPQDFPGGIGGGNQIQVLNFEDILKQEVIKSSLLPK